MKTKIKWNEVYWTNWRFWFKAANALLLIAVLLDSLISGALHVLDAVNKDTGVYTWVTAVTGENQSVNIADVSKDYILNHKDLFRIDYDSFFLNWTSFFTMQSNLLVMFWFLILSIFHFREGNGKVTGSYFAIGVATYISITALIFNFMLFPVVIGTGEINDWTANDWFTNEILHTLSPIMCVVYIACFMNHKTLMGAKEFWQKRNWIYILYPILYGIITLLVGELKRAGNWDETYQYPYFFMKVHDAESIKGVPIPGWAWFIIAVILIVGISLGFAALYNYAAKKTRAWEVNQKYQVLMIEPTVMVQHK